MSNGFIQWKQENYEKSYSIFFCCLRIKIIRSFTIYDAFPFIFYPTSKLRKLFPIWEKAINNLETAIAKKDIKEVSLA